MPTGTNRLHSIDLLRGFAVILMVMGHTIDSILDHESRTTVWFTVYDFLRGFTAPTFLFTSGLAFAVATERRWIEYLSWTPALRKRLGRILLLFTLGYALHLPYFSLEKTLFGSTPEEISGFLKTDILQCIAACLLVLHTAIILFRTPRRFTRATIGLTAIIAVCTPVVWTFDVSPLLTTIFSPFVNTTQLSVFPLFPYAAFMFAGVVTGHSYFTASSQGRTTEFVVTIALTSALFAAAGILLDLLPFRAYPEHDFWKTSPLFFLVRIAGVLQLTVLFYFLRDVPGRIQSLLTSLGQSSLLIYTVHIVIVYGSPVAPGLFQTVGQTQPAPIAAAAGVLLLLAMYLTALGWEYIRSNHLNVSRLVQAGLTATVVSMFLLRAF